MIQVAFLDTNIILDYLENRNQEVRDILAQLLLLQKKGRIVLATSVFNIAELIDNEFQIHFIAWCLKERMSYDEVISKINRDERLFNEISNKNKREIERRIRDFIFKKGIKIFSLEGGEEYNEIYNLIYERNLRSQDALIVATALKNRVTYFLSNDSNLLSRISDLVYVYNLRDDNMLESFRRDVLEAI